MIKVYDMEKPRIVLIASPNNPRKQSTEGRLHRFLDACRVHLFMIDEAYWGFGSIENDYVNLLLMSSES